MFSITMSLLILILSPPIVLGVSLLNYDGSEIKIDLNTSVTCKKARECSNCNVGRFCVSVGNDLVQFGTINCGKDSNTPYCDPTTGLCSSMAANNCPSNGFICPNVDGSYPDPTSCSAYHVCSKGIRRTNICAQNNVYDHELGECRFRRYSFDCVTFNCNGKDGQTILYPKDNRIFATCVNGRAFVTGRCQNWQRYDSSLNKCVRTCNKVENQPQNSGDSQTDCQTYIRCANVGRGKYEPVVHYCSCDEGFDLKSFTCSNNAACLANITSACRLSESEDDDKGEDKNQETSVKSKIVQRSLKFENLVIVNDDDTHGILMNVNENVDNVSRNDSGPALVSFITNSDNGDVNSSRKQKRSIVPSIIDIKDFIDRLIQWLTSLFLRTSQGNR